MKKLEDKLPQFLIEELNKQYGEEVTKEILNGYMESRVVSLRVNTLKTTIDEVCSKLKKENIEFVLTGRCPSKKILDIADYVTEMKKAKLCSIA